MSMTGRDYTTDRDQFVARLAGYHQRLTMLERGHVHPGGTPLGTIVMFAGPEMPEGWLPCDGQDGRPSLDPPPGTLFIIKLKEENLMNQRSPEPAEEAWDGHTKIPLDRDEDGRWLDANDPRRKAAEDRLGHRFDDDPEQSRRDQRKAERKARRGD